MKYQVVGLNYGCEVDPTIAALRITFPEATFTTETTIGGTFSSSWAIFVGGNGLNAADIDRMRAVGAAFRDGFSKGFVMGFNDACKIAGKSA